MASTILTERPEAEGLDSRDPPAARATVRVLHVINGEHYAGAERVQDLLAQQLGPFGFEVGFVCLKPGQFPRLRQSQHVALYELPMRGRFDLRAVWRLVRIVRREGYGLLHSHSVRTLLIASLSSRITGVPLVHHVHSPTSRDSTRPWQDRFNARIEAAGLRRASAVIAVSESLGQYLRGRGIAPEKICVVHNGVPCRRPAPPRDPAKRQWTLGSVALMRPRKGIEVLLKALAILKSEGLPVRLRAVGRFETPQYECQIKRLSDELGIGSLIDWTGFTRDVDAQLAQMDVFILPSLFGEGLPMVVLEAMAAGVPVVATRVEGTAEAVRDGQDGLIVAPNDPADLAAAVRRLIHGEVDWHAMRNSALGRHAEQFSEQSMAAGVAQVYRRVLGP